MACVLVVDDDPDVREAVADALADAGYSVVQAENGVEAMIRMREGPPCIVLLDLMMPVMNGWEVVGAMDADPALSAIPVCIVSAHDRDSPPHSTYVLRKPASLASLIATVQRHCGGSRAA